MYFKWPSGKLTVRRTNNSKREIAFFHQIVYSALAKAFAEAAIVYKPNVASCCCRCESPGCGSRLGLPPGTPISPVVSCLAEKRFRWELSTQLYQLLVKDFTVELRCKISVSGIVNRGKGIVALYFICLAKCILDSIYDSRYFDCRLKLLVKDETSESFKLKNKTK